jgi:hypothetical protein
VIAFDTGRWQLLEKRHNTIGSTAAIDNITSTHNMKDLLASKQVDRSEEAVQVTMNIGNDTELEHSAYRVFKRERICTRCSEVYHSLYDAKWYSRRMAEAAQRLGVQLLAPR